MSEVTQEELSADELRNRWLRAIAEIDNLNKRYRKELEETRDRAEAEAILKLLPVVDDVQRAMQAAVDAKGRGALKQVREGLRLVLAQVQSCLHQLGVEGFESRGQQFSRDLMEAIAEVPTNKLPPGTVVDEVTPGYKRRGRLLRPAQVAVASEASEEDGDEESESDPA